jgi:hypothetical protein
MSTPVNQGYRPIQPFKEKTLWLRPPQTGMYYKEICVRNPSLWWPYHVQTCDQWRVVSDSGNNRVKL